MVSNKIGQFKIQQTIFMILAVILLFVLIFLFWMALKYRSLHEDVAMLEENKAVLMAEYLSGATEFGCAYTQYCIDTDKLLMLKNLPEYGELFNVNYIKVRKLFPEEQEKECSVSNYPDCNMITLFDKKQEGSASGSFVALCRYESRDGYAKRICELGRLIVGYEIQ